MNIICILWDGWTAIAAIATGLSAIATSIMVCMTKHSLKQNKLQLDEIKKQYEEENRARLIFEIVSIQDLFLLKIANIGKNTAYDVHFTIKSKLIDNHFSKEIKSCYEQTNQKNFILSPGRSLYLFISSVYTSQSHTIFDKNYLSTTINEWLDKYKNEKIYITGQYCGKYKINEEFTISDYIGMKHSIIIQDDTTLAIKDIYKEIKKHNANIKSISSLLERIDSTYSSIADKIDINK